MHLLKDPIIFNDDDEYAVNYTVKMLEKQEFNLLSAWILFMSLQHF